MHVKCHFHYDTFKPGDLRHHVNPLVVIDLDLLPVGDDVIDADGKVVQEGAAQGEAVIQEFTYRVETAASEKKSWLQIYVMHSFWLKDISF